MSRAIVDEIVYDFVLIIELADLATHCIEVVVRLPGLWANHPVEKSLIRKVSDNTSRSVSCRTASIDVKVGSDIAVELLIPAEGIVRWAVL